MRDVEKWLNRIFKHEGEYWDDPVGGPTKYGISQRSYPHLDIKNLSIQEAADIYKKDFLEKIKYERYEDGVAFQLLDFAIHSGVSKSIKTLQKAIGVTEDGIAGEETFRRIEELIEPHLIILLLAYRLRYLTNLTNWNENSRGWARRIADNLLYAVEDTKLKETKSYG